MEEAEARDLTVRHLHGLVVAVHNYSDTTNSLPPAVVSNDRLPPEKRLSGLVLLLPYLDKEWFGEDVSKAAQELINGMDLEKAWDDPVNLKAAKTVVSAFLAPRSGPFRDENGFAVSHFAFVRGAQGVDNGIFTDNGGIPVESISDGTVDTFAIGQINKHLGPWTAAGPSTSRHTYDSQHSTDETRTFGSNWPGGYFIAMADSSVGFLNGQCPANYLYAHTTRAGGEIVFGVPRTRYWKYHPARQRASDAKARKGDPTASAESSEKTELKRGRQAVDEDEPPTRVATAENDNVNSCQARMRQITFSVHLYAEQHQGKLPPAASYDADGKPLLSWRVQLLPHMEQQSLYDEFHFDESWDSPHNRKLIRRMPALFACPNQKAEGGKTCYLAPVGKATLFPPKGEGFELDEIPDGTSQTILFLEVNDEHAVTWTKPDDLSYDRKVNPISKLIGHHKGGFNIQWADGSTLFVRETVDPETIHRAINREDGKPLKF